MELNFLLRITQVSNKDLSKAIAVDPSLVSLLRSGKRKQPQNTVHITNMANFFAEKIVHQYQRTALAEAMNVSAVKKSLPKEILAKHIAYWLQTKDDIISQIVNSINNPIITDDDNNIEEDFPKNTSMFYYEEAGRKEAIEKLSTIIQNINEKCSILIISEDDLDWLIEDYQLTKKIQQRIYKTLLKGFDIYQVLPSMNNMNRSIEGLQFWLPIYVSGQSKVYYYPRLRDNLVRRSIMVIPGHAALITTNISNINRNYVTLLTTDLKLVDTYTRQYEDYLTLCRPAFQFEYDHARYIEYIEEILDSDSDIIQLTNCLSINSFSKEFIEAIKKSELSKYSLKYDDFYQMIDYTISHLQHHRLIELFYIPSVQEVIDNEAVMISYSQINNYDFKYNLETYILHLKNILYLLTNYENYYVAILPKNMICDYNMFINDDGIANLISGGKNSVLMKIVRTELVESCREQLYKLADKYGYNGFNKTKNIIYIQELIEQAQKAMTPPTKPKSLRNY